MTQSFSILGMTCMGCTKTVRERLETLEGAEQVIVGLANKEAVVKANRLLTIAELQEKLPKKYTVESITSNVQDTMGNPSSIKSKWVQLRPLLLIFVYLTGATFLMHYKNWSTVEAMLDFMGLFFVVFSFFKFLDLKGFVESFGMYDPLAIRWSAYGWAYPFLELLLGLMFLLHFQVQAALWITVLVLGITSIGVTKTLLDKKNIRCACLGTAMNLPMTEATFIENAIMLVMAFYMLI